MFARCRCYSKTGGTFKTVLWEQNFITAPGTAQRLTGSSSGGGADADPFAAPVGSDDGAGEEGIKFDISKHRNSIH